MNLTATEKNIIMLAAMLNLGNRHPLDWEDIMDALKRTASGCRISNPLKLILTTNGSVTRALEVLAGRPVGVRTVSQKVIKISKTIHPYTDRLLEFLNIQKGAAINFRRVWLTDGVNNYVYAISLTPIHRLRPPFKEDLMKADIPIGKLLVKYKIESRREIFAIDRIDAATLSEFGISWDDIKDNTPIPYRIYKIISNEEILMAILEFFYPYIM